MGKPVLTLDTLEPDRAYIEIRDGEGVHKVELRNQEELSLRQLGKITRAAKRIGQELSADSDDEGFADAETFAEDVLRVVLVNPDPALLAKLTTAQKFQIVQAFHRVGAEKQGATTTQETTPSTSGGPSPDSAGSTAEGQSGT